MITKELSDFVKANEKEFEIHYFNEKKPFIRCVGTGHEFTNPTVAQLEAHRQSKRVKLKVLRAAVDYTQYEPHIVPTREPHQLWCKLTRQYINKIPHEIEAHIQGRRYQVALERVQSGKAKSRDEGSESGESDSNSDDDSNQFESASQGSESDSGDGLEGSEEDSGEQVDSSESDESDSKEGMQQEAQKTKPNSAEVKQRSEEKSAKVSREPIELSKNDIFSIVHRPFKGQVNVNDLVALSAKKEAKDDSSKMEYARKKFAEADENDEVDSEDDNAAPFDRARQKIYMGETNVLDDDGEFEVVPESESGSRKFEMSDDSDEETKTDGKKLAKDNKPRKKNKNKKKNNHKNGNKAGTTNSDRNQQKKSNANSKNNSNSNQKRKFQSNNNASNSNSPGGSKKPKF